MRDFSGHARFEHVKRLENFDVARSADDSSSSERG